MRAVRVQWRLPPGAPWGGGRFTTGDPSLSKLPAEVRESLVAPFSLQLDLKRAWAQAIIFLSRAANCPTPSFSTYVFHQEPLFNMLRSSVEWERPRDQVDDSYIKHLLNVCLMQLKVPSRIGPRAKTFLTSYVGEVTRLIAALRPKFPECAGMTSPTFLAHLVRSVEGAMVTTAFGVFYLHGWVPLFCLGDGVQLRPGPMAVDPERLLEFVHQQCERCFGGPVLWALKGYRPASPPQFLPFLEGDDPMAGLPQPPPRLTPPEPLSPATAPSPTAALPAGAPAHCAGSPSSSAAAGRA